MMPDTSKRQYYHALNGLGHLDSDLAVPLRYKGAADAERHLTWFNDNFLRNYQQGFVLDRTYQREARLSVVDIYAHAILREYSQEARSSRQNVQRYFDHLESDQSLRNAMQTVCRECKEMPATPAGKQQQARGGAECGTKAA